MHAWEAIQKTLDIIEGRIGEEISIEELADTAALSLFYYQRLFSRLVKKPVREYVKLRRLARACEALKNTDARILDIALDYGFGSHEAFTRAFKDAYNITPTEYRESNILLNNFDKPDLALRHTLVDLGVPLISDGIVLEINRVTLDKPITFAGFSGNVAIAGKFPNGETTGVDELGEMWHRFNSDIEHTIPSSPNARKIGVAYHGSAPEGSFSYFVGKETAEDSMPKNLEKWALPAAEYIVNRFEAENFEELVTVALNKAINYGQMWQKKNDLKFGDFGAEIYYDNTEEFAYMEIWALWLE